MTTVAIIATESAFWLDEHSANPAREIIAAVKPALLTTGGPLIQISTPYAKAGQLWDSYEFRVRRALASFSVYRFKPRFRPTQTKREG